MTGPRVGTGRSVALCVALAVIAGCATDKVTGEKRFSVTNWTTDEEIAFGREAAPNIESEFDSVYPDQEAHDYLQSVIEELVEHSPRGGDFRWRFRILNTSMKNAFALPGGFVYITRGLLEHLETEGEFAFTLGHEIGHVEHRHTMLQRSRATVATIFTAPVTVPINAVTSVAVGPGGRLLANVGRLLTSPSRLLLARYSRSHESEADDRGVYFAAEMGFDPRDSQILLEFFRVEEKKRGGPSGGWLSHHPLTADRIDRVGKKIHGDYPDVSKRPGPVFRPSSAEFTSIVTKLKERTKAYQYYDVAMAGLFKEKPNEFELAEAKRLLERAAKEDPEEPLFRVGLGEEAMMREDPAAARPHFTAAIELYETRMPGESHWKPHFYLGFLDVGAENGAAAVAHLERARSLFPLQPPIHFFLGEAYALVAQLDKAKGAFRKVLDLAPSGHELTKKARARLRRL